MTKYKYQKPAVQEVIFEAKFSKGNSDLAVPGQIFEKIKQKYPKKKDKSPLPIAFGNNSNFHKSNFLSSYLPKFQAWKSDDSALVQIGPGIILANQLTYVSWEDFTPSVQEIIDAYIDVVEPEYTSKLGIRYINRFLITEKLIKITDYFDLGLEIPEVFENLQGFDLTLINKLEKHEKYKATFEIKTKFMTDNLKPGESGSSFILDIHCHTNSPIKALSDQIIQVIQKAHDIIGQIFESIISDKIRDLMGVVK